MENEKWKITLKKEGNFNLSLQLNPTDFFEIDITNEDETSGGGMVNLSTLVHMIKHIGIVGADPKRWV
jgi:hypothetical protein